MIADGHEVRALRASSFWLNDFSESSMLRVVAQFESWEIVAHG